MIKNLLLLVLVAVSGGGEKFLEEIPLYKKDSYFKEKVFEEHSWKSFSALKEANQIVDPDNYDLHLVNASLFFVTNRVREEKKLQPLKYSAQLRDATVVHSQQMVEKRFFDHFNNKMKKLRSPEERMVLFGVQANAMGENIDYNNLEMPSKSSYIQLAEKIVDEWMHSAPHRKTMLSKTYTHLGCGAMFEASNKDGMRYIKATQDYSLTR